LSYAAGVSVVNRDYNQAFFGVTLPDVVPDFRYVYAPGGGLKDAHASVRWNWSMSPNWMLTTNAQVTRLLGSAADSPLVTRPTNLTVSTAIAYRF
jgi:outer membrane scaffolding protein for murein synthesis (MipA/OmpV family)